VTHAPQTTEGSDHKPLAEDPAPLLLTPLYLLFAKRLFGLRGGRRAYDAERHGEQLLEVERSALASQGGQAHDARTAPATGKVSP